MNLPHIPVPPTQSLVAKGPINAVNFVNDDLLAKRRDRKPNWSDREVARLIHLHHLYRSTLNSPGHDASTIALKQNVWLRITKGLNASFPGHPMRSYKEVQKKWGNLKSEAKKRAQFALLHQLDPISEVASILPQEVIDSMSNAVIKTELLDQYSPVPNDAQASVQSAIEETIAQPDTMDSSSFHDFTVGSSMTSDIDFSAIQEPAEERTILLNGNQDDASLKTVGFAGFAGTSSSNSVSTSTEMSFEDKSCQTESLATREDLEREKLEEEIFLLREQRRFWSSKRQLKIAKLDALRKANGLV